MNADKRQISDIFNGNRVLEIPFFQRTYVWAEDQWERFLEDMETVSQRNELYFMGSVILKQIQTDSSCDYGDVRTLIDGQQRLTTLNILFKVLALKTGDDSLFVRTFRLIDNKIALRHNHNDLESFEKIMNLTNLVELDNKNNITEAYNYFRKELLPEKIDANKIIRNIAFVGIDLSVDEDEQQIFDTINSLGVRLTTAELLKNFLFGREDIEIYEKYWQNIFEMDDETNDYWDQDITTGRFKRSLIDLFFFSYLQVRVNTGDISVKTEDKNLFAKVDRLFDSYKRFIKEYLNNDIVELRKDIAESAVLFRNTFDYSIGESELSGASGIERISSIIFNLETTTLVPYVLYIEKYQTDDSVKNELYGFIESYIMRRMVVRATTKNYNKLFTQQLLANHVLTQQDFISFLSTQDDKVNYFPEDEELKDAFQNSRLTNKQSAGILCFIESKIRDRARHSTQLLGVRKYSLEHIMPKKWENYWGGNISEDEANLRNQKLLTLGNLTIITQSLNASIRDADWESKKNGRGTKGGLRQYADGIDTLSPYLKYPSWNEETIEERADFLYNKAKEIWKM